jgi:hypothetical protein
MTKMRLAGYLLGWFAIGLVIAGVLVLAGFKI